MLAQLNLVLWAWIESSKDLARWRVWRPFLLLALAQVLVVLLLTQFYRPGISAWLAPLLERLSGPGALHYPQFFVALPGLFSQVNMLIDWLVGSFAIGAALVVIWARASGGGSPREWRSAARRYLPLLLTRLPLLVLLYLLAWQLPRLFFAEGQELTGAQVRMLRYGTFFAGVILESLFVYAPVILMLEGRSVTRAWSRGISLLGRLPVASLLVVMVPNLLQLPTSWVLRRSDRVVENLAPELVGVLVGLAVLVYVFVNLFIVGSAVRLYGARGERPEGRVS